MLQVTNTSPTNVTKQTSFNDLFISQLPECPVFFPALGRRIRQDHGEGDGADLEF